MSAVLWPLVSPGNYAVTVSTAQDPDLPRDLLLAQRDLMEPIAAAMKYRVATANRFDRTLLLWRYETATATLRFLDALLRTPATPSAAPSPAAAPSGPADVAVS